MPVLKEYINPNITEFKDLLKRHFNDLNFENESFINELFEYVYAEKVKGSVSFQSRCRAFFKEKRNGKPISKLTIEYWRSRGHNDEYASIQISKIQSNNTPTSIDHWLSKGLNENEAKDKIKSIQSSRSNKRYKKYTKEEISRQSAWSIDYWIDLGYSEEDAIKKAHSLNYGCREFWSSDAEYQEIKKIIANKTRLFIKNNPDKYKSFFGSVSKEEVSFFTHLTKEIDNIKHCEFIVNVKKDDELDQGIIKYDGYFKLNNILILIEYDGIYWHNQAYDDIKDKICLRVRPDVTGIIRISSERYKTDKNIIELIQNGIEEIKSKKCNRVKLY